MPVFSEQLLPALRLFHRFLMNKTCNFFPLEVYSRAIKSYVYRTVDFTPGTDI